MPAARPRRTTANHRLGALALAAAVLPTSVFATNGYFTNGSSIQSNGLGGAGIAFPVDALAGYINPAGIAFVGNRVDVGLTVFNPDRSATITGNQYGADGSYSGNGVKYFLLPEAGYTHQVADDLYVGLSLTANGGMNTGYHNNPYGAFGGQGEAGVNLQQIVLTPALAYKITPTQSIGIGANIAWQRFYADGLTPFAAFSQAPGSVSNTGYSSSVGVGARVGWNGHFGDNLTLGATWASKIPGSFNGYQGLFAQSGSFDIPANFGIGAAYRVTSGLTLLADVQRILYAETHSVGNPLANLLQGHALGSSDGPGFGWRDINIYKVAVSYAYSPTLTLRFGFSHAQQPIPSSQTFFNILAPGVVQNQASVGATWQTSQRSEISFYYSHAFEKTVYGSSSIPAPFGGGEADIALSENSLGFAYAWKI